MLCVLTRISRATTQRCTPAALPIPRPRYLISSAPGFSAGGESTHELLAEVLASKLTRVQACCAISDVTLFKHCGAMALFALMHSATERRSIDSSVSRLVKSRLEERARYVACAASDRKDILQIPERGRTATMPM